MYYLTRQTMWNFICDFHGEALTAIVNAWEAAGVKRTDRREKRKFLLREFNKIWAYWDKKEIVMNFLHENGYLLNYYVKNIYK